MNGGTYKLHFPVICPHLQTGVYLIDSDLTHVLCGVRYAPWLSNIFPSLQCPWLTSVMTLSHYLYKNYDYDHHQSHNNCHFLSSYYVPDTEKYFTSVISFNTTIPWGWYYPLTSIPMRKLSLGRLYPRSRTCKWWTYLNPDWPNCKSHGLPTEAPNLFSYQRFPVIINNNNNILHYSLLQN